jgi:pimeloyl-ACP methyl ester carboxylesterase
VTNPIFPDLPTEPPAFEIVGAETRDGVLVRDIRIAAPPGAGGGVDDATAEPIEAYLVEPEVLDARASRPGLLFAHWFDTEAPNGNRTEYLDEAADWARRHRSAAVLPQLTFPWSGDPTGSAADSGRIVAEVTRLRRCLDLILARPAVDPEGIGVVGHDFGGMHGALLATVDRRPTAYVLVAAVPRWGDWFLPFWPIEEDRIDYLRAMRPLDPIEHLGKAAPARILFQFGRHDFYIAPMTGREFARAASEAGELKAYDAEHDMAPSEIVVDRTTFLERQLRTS